MNAERAVVSIDRWQPEHAVVSVDRWQPERAALLLGVPVDDVTMDEAVDAVVALVGHGRRAGTTNQVATVNVDFIVNAVRDGELAALMRRTALSIPDGMPVIWASRLLGTPLRERVAGVDLVTALVDRAASSGITVALVGGAPGVADQAAEVLAARSPGARLTAWSGPSFSGVDELELADLEPLIALDPDICLVAFGNPKQERFIARFGAELGIPVMIGVGGSFDFLIGRTRRAPEWMQRAGLEWLHRAASEPRRLLRRYLRDARVFFPRIVAQVWSGRRWVGCGSVDSGVARDGALVVDLSKLVSADNRTAGHIVGAARTARRATVPVRFEGCRRQCVDHVPGLSGIVELS